MGEKLSSNSDRSNADRLENLTISKIADWDQQRLREKWTGWGSNKKYIQWHNSEKSSLSEKIINLQFGIFEHW